MLSDRRTYFLKNFRDMVHLTSYDENQVDVVVLRTTLIRILSRGVKHSKCLVLDS